jgi:hypothetical protein
LGHQITKILGGVYDQGVGKHEHHAGWIVLWYLVARDDGAQFAGGIYRDDLVEARSGPKRGSEGVKASDYESDALGHVSTPTTPVAPRM